MIVQIFQLLRKAAFRTLLLGVVLMVLIAAVDFGVGVIFATKRTSPDIRYYYNVIGDDKIIALTFDDGPDPVKTEKIMEILDRHEVPATFFLMGSNVLKYPEIVESIHDSGYEIGNHSYTHSRQVHSSQSRLELELNVTDKLIKNITGKSTLLYRPPFLLDIGSDPIADPATPNTALNWVNKLGYVSVGADIDSLDWSANSAQEIIDNVLAGLEYGHIVLLHDGGLGKYTVEALEPLIVELKKRDYKFVDTSTIVGLNAGEGMRVNVPLALGTSDGGSEGPVSALQRFLLKEGEFDFDITGYFGPITRSALMSWQVKHGLSDELGFVGSQTIGAIEESLRSNYQLEFVPHVISEPNLERKLQTFYTFMSAATKNRLPIVLVGVLVLVVLRIGVIGGLMVWAVNKKGKVIKNPRRGVSVIIPAHNEEANIEATVASVVENRYPNYEIVVVDDGSTDGTVRILKRLQKKYGSKLCVITSTNQGKAKALNLGIAKSRYRTLVTIDGDTVLEKGAIKEVVSKFGDKQVAGVAGKVCVSGPNNLLTMFQHLEYMTVQNLDKRAFGSVNAVGVIPGPIGAWRKKDIVELGGFSTDTLVEDQDLTLALLAKGKKVVYAERAVAYTEAPYRLGDLFKQRVRWIRGTIQCLWKYKFYLLNPRRPQLGFLILPNVLIYTIVLSVFYPVINGLFVVSLLTPVWREMWNFFLLFLLVDYSYTVIAFISERRYRKLLLMLPMQRLFYHLVMNVIVIKSVLNAIEGSTALWSRVFKRGEAAKYHFEAINYQSAMTVAVPNRHRW